MTADVDAAYSLGFRPARRRARRTTGSRCGRGARISRCATATALGGASAPERAESALAAAVTFGQAENPFEITLKLGVGKVEDKKKGGEVVPLAVGISLRFVTLVPDGAARSGRVSVRVAIQDARGRMLASTAAIVPIVVPENQMERALVSLLGPPRRDAPCPRPAACGGGGPRRDLGRAVDGVRGARDPGQQVTQASISR